MSECWLLAGFEPRTPLESELLTGIRGELGFSPVESAERLMAKDEQALKSPKRVLDVSDMRRSGWQKQNAAGRSRLKFFATAARNTGLDLSFRKSKIEITAFRLPPAHKPVARHGVFGVLTGLDIA